MRAIFVLVSVLFCSMAFGQSNLPNLDKQFTPFKEKVMKKLYRLEDISSGAEYASQDGHFALRVAKVTYDVAVNGGTVGTKTLGVQLPAKALIKQVWFYIDTQFTDAGSGTVALQCEDSANLYGAADVTGLTVGTVTSGIPTGTAANMVKSIASACSVQAVVAGVTQATGKMTIFIEYVVHY